MNRHALARDFPAVHRSVIVPMEASGELSGAWTLADLQALRNGLERVLGRASDPGDSILSELRAAEVRLGGVDALDDETRR